MKLDRRTVLVGAGASVALAACAEQKNKAEIVGTCEPFGDVPKKPGTTPAPQPRLQGAKPPPPSDVAFKPKFFAILYVGFNANGLEVRHAHFSNPIDGSAVQPYAESLLAMPLQDWPTQDDALYKGYKIWRANENFQNWFFQEQQPLFALFDGPGVTIDPEILMLCTPIGSKGNGKDPNHAFFNAEIITGTGALKNKEILRVENYFSKKEASGKYRKIGTNLQQKDDKAYYSVNFHLLMGSADIPIIVDPDTGNMGGGGGGEP